MVKKTGYESNYGLRDKDLFNLAKNELKKSRSSYKKGKYHTRKKIPGYIHVNSYHETPESDVLIHLAEEPDRHIVNVKGKAYMHEAIKLSTALSKKKYKKIIYASSGAVYGNSSVKPHKVSDDAVSNDSYSSIKLECEKIILDAGGLVARFSNLYGTGMSDNNVVSDIANQMSNDDNQP